MPRDRYGVVLLIPPPLDREVDALRRATGDGTYGRVPAHLTLVPPVNVNHDQLGDVLAVLRGAAASTSPFTVHLGAPTTFLPANPVLYLPVTGDGRDAVFALREAVFVPPLARPLTWPYVPHVTVADEVAPDRIAAAEVALAGYTAEVTFDRVHLLQEGDGRVWGPVADARFEPLAVVGRGGLPLELATVSILDPLARAFVERECGPVACGRNALAVVGRRDGDVVAVAEGWAHGGAARLERIVVAPPVRREGIGSHVLAAFESAAADVGSTRLATAVGRGTASEGLLRGRGWVDDPRPPSGGDLAGLVHLRRDRRGVASG